MQLRYHIAKNFGSKKVWRIRTAGSFTENNYGELKIHFHWECYGNSKINKKMAIPSMFLLYGMLID